MMARHWTESEDTAVRLGAALDNDRGGQRQRELAARLDRTQAGLSGGEVRGARWAEINKSARVWTIPATRMKAKREHRVPLSGRAVEILKAARKLGDGRSRLVFPSRGDKPISITRLPRMLQNLKIAAVPHGFRSSFRDWAAEETNHPREVVEAALAHAVANQTEAAYARSDLFERRRLMDEWAEYISR